MLNIQNPYSLAKFFGVHDALFKKLGSMKVLFWDLEILPHIKSRFPHYYSTNNLKSNKKLKIQYASSKKFFFKFPVNSFSFCSPRKISVLLCYYCRPCSCLHCLQLSGQERSTFYLRADSQEEICIEKSWAVMYDHISVL